MKPHQYPEQPAQLWQHFYDISRIPRPSGHEQAIRDYIVELAQAHGATTRMDDFGNLAVYVAASSGREHEATVLIQNHLDMVTVKTESSSHDFEREPLQLRVEEGWLLASNTTLGADNGVGCAAALALMTDPKVSHPALELLFTVEEETGLFGASALDPELVSAKHLINLDTEDWGELFIGCSGGRGWVGTADLQWESTAPRQGWSLELKGLAGGHSGIDIHRQHGNAIQLLGEVLETLAPHNARVAGFSGGEAHNVIPRSARLLFSLDLEEPALIEHLESLLVGWRRYLPAADSGLEWVLQAQQLDRQLSLSDQLRLQQLLALHPHGAQRYSLDQPGELVDLSVNLAQVRADEEGLLLETTIRFFRDEEARPLQLQLLRLAELIGLRMEKTVDYPGWEPVFDGGLLEHTQSLYQQLFDSEAAVKAIHAGLECGIVKSKRPSLDVISFGPTIRGAHSPQERLEIKTVMPFWQLLTGLLAAPLP